MDMNGLASMYLAFVHKILPAFHLAFYTCKRKVKLQTANRRQTLWIVQVVKQLFATRKGIMSQQPLSGETSGEANKESCHDTVP